MSDILKAVQKEVTRVREMITETKTLLPNRNVNFYMYELTLREADQAIREQNIIALIRLLPELESMQ